jgi:propionyl-CoA carboxylase alpha chain
VLGPVPSGWRIGRLPPQRVSLAHGDDVIDVHYQSRRDGSFALGDRSDGGTARVHRWSGSEIDVEIDGRRTTAQVTRAGDRLHVQTVRGTITFDVVPRFVVPGAAAPSGGLMAPMPGVVLDVRCAPGDQAEAGQILVVLEAMKMEHVVRAPADGVVADVRVAKGQHVENGALLLVFEPADSPESPGGFVSPAGEDSP